MLETAMQTIHGWRTEPCHDRTLSNNTLINRHCESVTSKVLKLSSRMLSKGDIKSVIKWQSKQFVKREQQQLRCCEPQWWPRWTRRT